MRAPIESLDLFVVERAGNATTRIAKGRRICIAPPATITAALPRQISTTSAGRRRRQLLQATGAEALAARVYGRRLQQASTGDDTAQVCLQSAFVAVGQSCNDIAAAYGIQPDELVALNPSE